ncbi:MAG: hypothetical protein PHP45_00500 [Elusimicrobiales bacterium]|nr:hypothetical protein [Elusimicrobiales bacterium]
MEIRIIYKVPNTPDPMPSIVKSLHRLADDLARWNPPDELLDDKGELIGEVMIGEK